MTVWFIVIYHSRTCIGWTGSLMGCEQRSQGKKECWNPGMGPAWLTQKGRGEASGVVDAGGRGGLALNTRGARTAKRKGDVDRVASSCKLRL